MQPVVGGLTPDAIRFFRGQGRSDAWIGRLFGVTRQAVSKMADAYGLPKSQHRIARDSAPFLVNAKMNRATVAQRLRAHRLYVLFPESHGLPEKEIGRLRSFYRKLENEDLIVEFDPTIPPNPGVSPNGGFAYRKREPRDGNLILRLNEYTYVEDEYEDSSFHETWSFPTEYP